MADQVTQRPDAVSVNVRELAVSDPGRTAISLDGRLVSYAELDARADALAATLVEALGAAELRVAVRAEDLVNHAVAVLGVLRAGMTLVALDPASPWERARLVIEDVGPSALLTDLGEVEQGLLTLTTEQWGLDKARLEEPASVAAAASINFTSGSTGRPKGIVFGRAAVDRLGTWIGELGDLDEHGRLGLLAVGSNSATAAGLRGAFLSGATVVGYRIYDRGLADLGEWLRDERITVFPNVPTLSRFLLPTFPPELHLPELKSVLLWGEAPTWEDAAAWHRHLAVGAQVTAVYGSTEAGAMTHFSARAGDELGAGPLPAGRAFSDGAVEVVDSEGLPCLPGEVGEVVFATLFAPSGYWRRPELTADTYRTDGSGVTRVRTGDAGLLREDGVLELRGRLDHVVKVRGHRVELGEVESGLRGLSGVADAVAVGRPDARGDVSLLAWVVPSAGHQLSGTVLRAELARRLPAAMLPRAIGVLPTLPQLRNGKVDRAALPEEIASEHTGRPVADGLESVLAAVWSKVLDVPDLTADDDFFLLGGDSLLAAQMLVEVEERTGFDRPPTVLVDAPTIALLARALQSSRPGVEPLVPVRPDGDLPPLFLVHGSRGDVLWARALAEHLDDDQPVYGLRSPALDGLPLPEQTLTELAARYVAAVLAVRPQGPYRFGGYSFGAAVAHEMTRLVEASGHEVELLVLGDAEARRLLPSRGTRGEIGSLVRALHHGKPGRSRAWELLRAARHPRRGRVERASVSWWRAAAAASESGTPVPTSLRGDWAHLLNVQLLGTWEPQATVAAPALLLRTGGTARGDLGWSSLVGALDVEDVPGTHFELMTAQVATTGAAVRRRLDRLRRAEPVGA